MGVYKSVESSVAKYRTTMNIMRNIDRIKDSDLQWQELADKVGISPSAFSRFRSGYAAISAYQMMCIADCLGVPLDELAAGALVR